MLRQFPSLGDNPQQNIYCVLIYNKELDLKLCRDKARAIFCHEHLADFAIVERACLATPVGRHLTLHLALNHYSAMHAVC